MDRTIYRSCSCCNCDFFVYGYHQSKDHCLKHNCHVNRNYDCCPNFQRLRVKIGDKIKFKYMNDIIEQTVINIHYISDCELYEVAFPVKDIAHHKVHPSEIIIEHDDPRRYTNVTVIWTEK